MPYSRTDLDYNRAGQLSPDQIERLQRGWRQARLGGGALVGFMVVLGLFLRWQGDSGALCGTGLFAAVVLGVLLMLSRTVRRVQREGAVQRVEGVVRHETEMDDGTLRHFLHVGDLRLLMEASDAANFVDGQAYRVYYIPTTGYVVSGEEAREGWR